MNLDFKTPLIVYSVGLYAHDAIKTKSLHLQNEYGVNVNIVLWLCWLDSNRLHLSPKVLEDALAIVQSESQTLLEDIRTLRLKISQSQSFTRVQEQLVRKHLVAAEVAVEKILLQRLQDLTARQTPVGAEDECLSLFDYLNRFNMDSSGQVAVYFLEEGRQFGYNLEALGQEATHLS
jgi:uncharacterized protein (TIGR02444 family)